MGIGARTEGRDRKAGEEIDIFKLVGNSAVRICSVLRRSDDETRLMRGGGWRKAVHCWAIATTWGDEPEDRPDIVLQQRGLDDWSYPNMLDISCSGVVGAGKSFVDAALEEIRGELLVKPDSATLYTYGLGFESGEMTEKETGLNPGKLPARVLNELIEIFLVQIDKMETLDKAEIDEILSHDGEVSALYSIKIDDGKRLFERAGGRIPARKLEIDMDSKRWAPTDEIIQISYGQIVPRHVDHYLKVLRRAGEFADRVKLAGRSGKEYDEVGTVQE